jgi:hypothetical protein
MLGLLPNSAYILLESDYLVRNRSPLLNTVYYLQTSARTYDAIYDSLIEGVSGGIVNILGGVSMDYSE